MAAPKPFRFGLVASQARSGEEWVNLARRAEELGFSTLFIPDTLGPTLAPFTSLAYAAAATSRLHVGTYVLNNDMRHPVLVAREAATLDLLSGGRFELGLGAGRPTASADYRAIGRAQEAGGVRVERLIESIGIIKALLNGQSLTTSGKHYTVDGATPFPERSGSRPPLLVAGSGKRLLGAAAREADIVAIGAPPDSGEDEVKERVGWVREAAGERFDALELNLNLVAVGEGSSPWLARLGLDPAELMRKRSPLVLQGSTDQMAEQLIRMHEVLGVSFVNAPATSLDVMAPVVARLAA